MFDVSHMGEVEVRGPRAAEAVQRLITNDVRKIAERGRALYTVACLPSGGIVDDLIVYRIADDRFLIVVNAANRAKDFEWFREQVATIADVVDRSDEYALIAVQGPRAVELVSKRFDNFTTNPATLPSFAFATGGFAGQPILCARTGYTGEDGFELLIPESGAGAAWQLLLDLGVKPCGLGARDTLRLEARLSLYGNDIDETTSPLEAGLGWVVKFDGGDFIGKAALAAQKSAGVSRKLVGFVMQERGIARHGYDIYAPEGTRRTGQVTSGGPSPTTGKNIGLGYVEAALAEPGQTLIVDCRGKKLRAEVVKGPFYKRGSSI
jgi:aminomethyltransferase